MDGVKLRGARAFFRRRRRRANSFIVRWLAEKRLRSCLILYRSAPQVLGFVVILTAFLPSSIRSAIAGMHDGRMPLLSHINFYLGFVAKGVAIFLASILLRERLSKAIRSSDRLLQKMRLTSAPRA